MIFSHIFGQSEMVKKFTEFWLNFSNYKNNFRVSQKDSAKYCFALTLLIEQLNGNISDTWGKTALMLLQEDVPETSVETILKELSKNPVSTFEIINSYRDFYAQTSSHKEASLRIVNKFN